MGRMLDSTTRVDSWIGTPALMLLVTAAVARAKQQHNL